MKLRTMLLAGVAMFGACESRADVVYSGTLSGVLATMEDGVPIDFNGDGVSDVQIGGMHHSQGELIGTPGAFVGTSCPWPEATPMWWGQLVGPASAYSCGTEPTRLQSWQSDGSWWSPYPFQGDGFLGVRFQLDGQTHYGWVHVYGGFNMLDILSYGYEMEPNTAIAAGVIEPRCPHDVIGPASERVAQSSVFWLYADIPEDVALSGYTAHWLHNGAPMDPNDPRYQGVNWLGLRVENVDVADAGEYAVRITTACGEVVSTTATIEISVPCGALTGSSLQFDTLGGTRGLSAATTLLNPAAVTIECWMNCQTIFSDRTGCVTGTGYQHLELMTLGTNALRFIPTPGVQIETLADTLPRYQWVHVAAVYDPAQSLAKIYINGMEQVVVNRGTSPITTPMVTGDASPLSVGVRASRPWDYYSYRGRLDDVRMWSYARTRGQITGAMRGVWPTEAGLLAYYRMNEGAGATTANAATATGAALDLTLTATMWYTTIDCCPADHDRSGSVGSGDLFAYLSAFFSGEASADFNGDAVLDSRDFFEYVAAFMVGCG